MRPTIMEVETELFNQNIDLIQKYVYEKTGLCQFWSKIEKIYKKYRSILLYLYF